MSPIFPLPPVGSWRESQVCVSLVKQLGSLVYLGSNATSANSLLCDLRQDEPLSELQFSHLENTNQEWNVVKL